MRRAWIVLSILLLAPPVWAARLDLSHKKQSDTSQGRVWQAFRCNEAATAGSVNAGEDCDSGDFSKVMDCRGFTTLKVAGHEYNATAGMSLDIKVWDCEVSEGFADVNIDPSASPTADTIIKPLCVQIMPNDAVTPTNCPDADGATDGWQIDGTAEACREGDGGYGYIVLEIDGCGGAGCGDATLLVHCSP